MDSILLSSAGAVLELQATTDIITNTINNTFLKAYIPSIKLPQEVNPSCKLTVQDSSANHVNINYPEANYYFTKTIDHIDIITLAEFLLERNRQEQGIICIHGACIIINDKAIIIWGAATGIGKTRLSLELINNAGNFYSDEKVLIDLKSNTVIGGVILPYLMGIRSGKLSCHS